MMWKDVVGYEGLYTVNENGEIYSTRSKKILKPFFRGIRPDNKYLVVDLHKNNKGKTISVHRIVAETFIPNPDNLPCVNHKDGNKFNNCVDNLEWVTYAENNQHAVDNGLKKYKKGTENKLSKLSYEQVVEIKQNLILGDPQFGARPLSKQYGVDHSIILDIFHDVKYQNVKIPYTLFVCSDIHGAYTPWMDALKKAGFNPNKYSHKIILCGDAFDRMQEAQEVYNFIMEMIDKNKLIYITGNHEDCLTELCSRGYWWQDDILNGTANTVFQLGCINDNQSVNDCCVIAQQKIKPLFNHTVNYYETAHYVFAHSFVPLFIDKSHYTHIKNWNPDWRNSSDEEWQEARWGNPFELAEEFWKEDKTLIFGHFHTSWARHNYHGEPEFGEGAVFDPYYGKNYIGIDACTVASGRVNVLVLEDELLEG